MEVMQELKEFGLNENEIKVYLACLNLGKSKVNDISIKANLIRTTTYGVLKALTEKGLISKFDKDKITFFQPVNPKELINILDEKKKKIFNILPLLEKMTDIPSEKYKLELFEGERGIKTILNEAISSPNTILKVIGTAKQWVDFGKEYLYVYYRKKKENKIKSFTLIADTKENREVYKNKDLKTNAQIKFSNNLSSEGALIIYLDKVAFVSYDKDNLRGFIIKDSNFSSIQNNLFDNLWQLAKK